jgi:hypothetical protein
MVSAVSDIPAGPTHEPGRHSAERVLVLYEAGRSGAAALARAARLIRERQVEVTMATVAPRDTSRPRCVLYTGALNDGVRAQATAELFEARRLLGSAGEHARYELLVDDRDHALEAWVAAGGFDLVLLPARRWRPGPGHPAARRLRRCCDAEVLVIRASLRSGVREA